jgi:hypothetical protein
MDDQQRTSFWSAHEQKQGVSDIGSRIDYDPRNLLEASSVVTNVLYL